MQPPELIDAGEISLRRWQPGWAEALNDAVQASLPELEPFMPWATAEHGLKQASGYIDRSVAQWDAREAWNYAIVGPDDAIIGSCGLMTRMGPGVLEIGYWVHSAYAGNGYATAAAVALSDVGLSLPGVERIAIKHDVANPASGRVAARAGFTEASRAEQEPKEPKAPGETGVEQVWELCRVTEAVPRGSVAHGLRVAVQPHPEDVPHRLA